MLGDGEFGDRSTGRDARARRAFSRSPSTARARPGARARAVCASPAPLPLDPAGFAASRLAHPRPRPGRRPALLHRLRPALLPLRRARGGARAAACAADRGCARCGPRRCASLARSSRASGSDDVAVVGGRVVAEVGHAGREVVADLVAVAGVDAARVGLPLDRAARVMRTVIRNGTRSPRAVDARAAAARAGRSSSSPT